jgi:hypothetical protein
MKPCSSAQVLQVMIGLNTGEAYTRIWFRGAYKGTGAISHGSSRDTLSPVL